MRAELPREIPGATVDEYEEYRWDVEKDRSVQDTVRLEVLEARVDLR